MKKRIDRAALVVIGLAIACTAAAAFAPADEAASYSYTAEEDILAGVSAAGQRYGEIIGLTEGFDSSYGTFFEQVDARDFANASRSLDRMKNALNGIGSRLGNSSLDSRFRDMLEAKREVVITLADILADARSGKEDKADYEKLLLQTVDAYEKTPTSLEIAVELDGMYKTALEGSLSPTYTESGAPSAARYSQ